MSLMLWMIPSLSWHLDLVGQKEYHLSLLHNLIQWTDVNCIYRVIMIRLPIQQGTSHLELRYTTNLSVPVTWATYWFYCTLFHKFSGPILGLFIIHNDNTLTMLVQFLPVIISFHNNQLVWNNCSQFYFLIIWPKSSLEPIPNYTKVPVPFQSLAKVTNTRCSFTSLELEHNSSSLGLDRLHHWSCTTIYRTFLPAGNKIWNT